MPPCRFVPDDDRAHRLRVLVLLDLKRNDEVLRSCDAALAQGKPWADIHEIRGVARAGRGDFAGAIDDYSQALVLRPGQPRVLSLRGLAYLASDSPRLALGDFDEALRLDASSAEAHGGRGLALVRLGDHRAAVAAAEESLRHDPASPRRALNAARIYAQAAIAAAMRSRAKGQRAVAAGRSLPGPRRGAGEAGAGADPGRSPCRVLAEPGQHRSGPAPAPAAAPFDPAVANRDWSSDEWKQECFGGVSVSHRRKDRKDR